MTRRRTHKTKLLFWKPKPRPSIYKRNKKKSKSRPKIWFPKQTLNTIKLNLKFQFFTSETKPPSTLEAREHAKSTNREKKKSLQIQERDQIRDCAADNLLWRSQSPKTNNGRYESDDLLQFRKIRKLYSTSREKDRKFKRPLIESGWDRRRATESSWKIELCGVSKRSR